MSEIYEDTTEANQEAFKRLDESEPILEDVLPAIETLPGMTENTILAAGPTMPWPDYVGGHKAICLNY